MLLTHKKTELDTKMWRTLQAEQKGRALEAQLDALLLSELDESKVSYLSLRVILLYNKLRGYYYYCNLLKLLFTYKFYGYFSF